MLGETRYYYVVDNGGPPYIDSTSNPNNTSNKADGAVWGSDAVTAVTDQPNSGKRPGLYWEKDKPIPGDESHNLPAGMIRVIGRYWHQPDSVYKVMLKTTYNGQTIMSDFPIYTIAPEKLLTPGQSPTYKLSRDVLNNPINIDSICILYGGIYGIPPHFLKGQMFTEAGHKDFGAYWGLAPSYRYEPFSRYAQLSKDWEESSLYSDRYWHVDPKRSDHKMGLGKDIPIHQNICDMDYPRWPKTVWDIIWDHSELVNLGSGPSDIQHRVYGSRENGIMIFPYSNMQEVYKGFLDRARLFSGFSTQTKEDMARGDMIVYLRDKWQGGAKDMVAQTRLASSYGLLQMMYDRAVRSVGFPCDDPQLSPEDFNITDTNMVRSLRYMKKLLQNSLTLAVEENGNWPNGFENKFKKYIWRIWNTGSSKGSKDALKYSKTVYTNVKRFFPQNN